MSNPYLELGSDIEATFNEDVDLEPIYIGPSSTNILWTPNQDLTCTDCLYTTANLEETTQFILTVNQGSRCAVSDSIRVVIVPEAIFLPTAFSPNNDGVNDLFRPLNTNLQTWNISVWNRWGELIYQTDDLTQGWDGSYKGKKQGIGVYTYEAQYQLEGRTKEYTQKGNVTLIR